MENKYNFHICLVHLIQLDLLILFILMYGVKHLFPTKGGHEYYVIFIDDHSRYTWIYFMKHRSQLCSIYQNFARMMHTQFSTSIKVFRSDSGGEYIFDALCQFLAFEGTLP